MSAKTDAIIQVHSRHRGLNLPCLRLGVCFCNLSGFAFRKNRARCPMIRKSVEQLNSLRHVLASNTDRINRSQKTLTHCTNNTTQANIVSHRNTISTKFFSLQFQSITTGVSPDTLAFTKSSGIFIRGTTDGRP